MPAKKTTSKAAKKTPAKVQPVDVSAKFEKLLKKANAGQKFVLRLFVTGSTVRSSQAIANVRSLCEEHLAGHYELEVVDIYQQPQEAARDQIIAAPTLIKELPVPVRRMIGDLSNRDKVLVGLNLVTAAGGGATKADKTRWVKL